MKVVCKVDDLHGIGNPEVLSRVKKYIRFPDGYFGLVLGREYNVYGVVFLENSPLVYVFLDEADEYPKPISLDFFEVSDARLSKYWRLSYSPEEGRESSSALAFDEWSQDFSFYERLIDGDGDALKIFNKYRLLMDLE